MFISFQQWSKGCEYLCILSRVELMTRMESNILEHELPGRRRGQPDERMVWRVVGLDLCIYVCVRACVHVCGTNPSISEWRVALDRVCVSRECFVRSDKICGPVICVRELHMVSGIHPVPGCVASSAGHPKTTTADLRVCVLAGRARAAAGLTRTAAAS